MSKLCAIHQPNLLPWIGYFYKIKRADVFIFLDNVDIVTATASSITNRTNIKSANGKLLLTAPIVKSDSKKIMDIQYSNQPWRKKILKSIEQAYSKSLNFQDFYPVLSDIILFEDDSLSNYNINAIQKICAYLNIQTKLLKASDYSNLNEERNQRIVDLCLLSDCNRYFSGNGAKKYHNEKVFETNKIEIVYTDFQHPVYVQRYGVFIEGLSVLDYLFNEELKNNILFNEAQD